MAHFIATKTLDEDSTTLAEILEKLNAFPLDFQPLRLIHKQLVIAGLMENANGSKPAY